MLKKCRWDCPLEKKLVLKIYSSFLLPDIYSLTPPLLFFPCTLIPPSSPRTRLAPRPSFSSLPPFPHRLAPLFGRHKPRARVTDVWARVSGHVAWLCREPASRGTMTYPFTETTRIKRDYGISFHWNHATKSTNLLVHLKVHYALPLWLLPLLATVCFIHHLELLLIQLIPKLFLLWAWYSLCTSA